MESALAAFLPALGACSWLPVLCVSRQKQQCAHWCPQQAAPSCTSAGTAWPRASSTLQPQHASPQQHTHLYIHPAPRQRLGGREQQGGGARVGLGGENGVECVEVPTARQMVATGAQPGEGGQLQQKRDGQKPHMRLPRSLRPHRPRGSHCPTGTCPALPPLPCSQRRRGTLPFSMPPLYHPSHPLRRLIPTPQAWLAQPACARTAQYLSQCYELHSHTLLPPPSPMRPLLAPRGL